MITRSKAAELEVKVPASTLLLKQVSKNRYNLRFNVQDKKYEERDLKVEFISERKTRILLSRSLIEEAKSRINKAAESISKEKSSIGEKFSSTTIESSLKQSTKLTKKDFLHISNAKLCNPPRCITNDLFPDLIDLDNTTTEELHDDPYDESQNELRDKGKFPMYNELTESDELTEEDNVFPPRNVINNSHEIVDILRGKLDELINRIKSMELSVNGSLDHSISTGPGFFISTFSYTGGLFKSQLNISVVKVGNVSCIVNNDDKERLSSLSYSNIQEHINMINSLRSMQGTNQVNITFDGYVFPYTNALKSPKVNRWMMIQTHDDEYDMFNFALNPNDIMDKISNMLLSNEWVEPYGTLTMTRG